MRQRLGEKETRKKRVSSKEIKIKDQRERERERERKKERKKEMENEIKSEIKYIGGERKKKYIYKGTKEKVQNKGRDRD